MHTVKITKEDPQFNLVSSSQPRRFPHPSQGEGRVD